MSEQDSIDPDNPELDYTPLRLSERAAKLGPLVSQGAASEPIRSLPVSRPALLARKAIDESAGSTRDLERRGALLSVAARTAAVAGVVAFAVLLFVIMKPASRESVAVSNPFEITGSIPQPNQGDVESKSTLAELKVPRTSPPTATPEQYQELLQRFLDWREKANPTEAPQ